jgi:hypothetical protein
MLRPRRPESMPDQVNSSDWKRIPKLDLQNKRRANPRFARLGTSRKLAEYQPAVGFDALVSACAAVELQLVPEQVASLVTEPPAVEPRKERPPADDTEPTRK